MKAIFEWRDLMSSKYPFLKLMYHISNEGKRKPWVAKRMGINAGIPDICLPKASRYYHGLYLEIKSPKKKPSDEQREKLELLRGQNYYATWTDNLQTAIDVLSWYIGAKEHEPNSAKENRS